MFGWNPFKKQQTPSLTPHESVEEKRDLLSEIVYVRDDTLGQDLRPMQRLIRDTTFLLPLHEPPIQSEEGTRLRYITLEDDEVMCAFTDEQRMRDFFRDYPSKQLAVSYQTGKTLCQMAEHGELRKLILNPNSDILFALPPMVYRTIAHGFVMGHICDEKLPEGPTAMGRCVAGMPGMDALDTFRQTLRQFGATEAWWASLFLPPDEMRFCLGVGAPQRAFETLPDQLVQNWIGRWPLPTPLYVYPLDATAPQRDAAFRQADKVL
ncbi:hypothetical protein IAD21_01125 [Abditibacteriota bacterium]|nr:hypothetical protein IAD21_01125 [Abditibacteriota bacterium]